LYPALIVTVLGVVAIGLSRKRLSWRALGMVLGATLVTVLPWNLYAFMRWPEQFVYEQFHALRHLSQDVEQYAGPWDRLVFDYWVQVFHVYYPAVLVAGIVVIIRASRLRDPKLWFLVAWAVGVLVPHLVATSKTPTATLIGWPPLWIMLGYLISQAIQGCGMSAGAWAAAMVAPLFLPRSAITTSGWGYPPVPEFAAIMMEHIWVVGLVVIALGVGLATAFARHRWLRLSLCAIAACSMMVLAVRPKSQGYAPGYGYLCWKAKDIGKNEPSFPAIGSFAQNLPRQATFIVDEQSKLENKILQFYARRSCYPLRGTWQEVAQLIVDAGGLPYLITDRSIDLPQVFEGDGRRVYAVTPKAQSAAERDAP
jgi:hypothetical protein